MLGFFIFIVSGLILGFIYEKHGDNLADILSRGYSLALVIFVCITLIGAIILLIVQAIFY